MGRGRHFRKRGTSNARCKFESKEHAGLGMIVLMQAACFDTKPDPALQYSAVQYSSKSTTGTIVLQQYSC